ncbi:MAG: DUF371 domain-containing protein, partial [Halolamina sp.]
DWLTPAGDCIVGVEADRAPAAFDPAFVAACQSRSATIEATVVAEAGSRRAEETVVGRGHPELTFENERSLVARTSTYVDDRTVLVDADRAAADFDRKLVTLLTRAEENASLTLTLRVED